MQSPAIEEVTIYTVGYDDFVKPEEAFNEVSGLTLLRAAFHDGNAICRASFCIAATAMLGGFVALPGGRVRYRA